MNKIPDFKTYIKESVNPNNVNKIFSTNLFKKVKNLFTSVGDDFVITLDDVYLKLVDIKHITANLLNIITLSYTDEIYQYEITFYIDLNDTLEDIEDVEKYDEKDIKSIPYKFKKYNAEMDLLGELNDKIKVDNIDVDMFIDFNVKFIDEFGDEGEDFSIEK